MGYLLSNGHCGVYFNDCTKMVSNSTASFFYIERNRELKEDVARLLTPESA